MSLTSPEILYCCLATPEAVFINACRSEWLISPMGVPQVTLDTVWSLTGEPTDGPRYQAAKDWCLLTPGTLIIDGVDVDVFTFDTVWMTAWDDYLSTGPDCAETPCLPLHFTDV